MDGNVTYNGNSLQTYSPTTRVGIITDSIKHNDVPASYGDVVPLANYSDSEVPTHEFISKSITITGTITGSTQADLDNRIDTFTSYFNRRNVNLDIVYNGATRRYTAMKINALGIERNNVLLFATFTIEIICKPFGIDTTATTIANLTAVTAATNTFTPTIAGSARYQQPILTITLTALTGTSDFLVVSNDLNGQQIVLTGLGLAAGDVIVIDSRTKSVTRNGNVVDYAGTFIEFETGAQSMTITDGFTTRTKNILVQYYKRYR